MNKLEKNRFEDTSIKTLWHFSRRRINVSKVRVEMISHLYKIKPGSMKKHSSTIGPPLGIEPTYAFVCDAGAVL